MIKKFGILTACFVLFSSAAMARMGNDSDFTIPRDRDGDEAVDVTQVGVRALYVTHQSTGFVSGSSITVYGVLTSSANSGSAGDPFMFFVNLRATNTANITSELLVPPIQASTNTYSKNTLVVFNPPLVAPDGLAVDISSLTAAVNLTTSTLGATVFWRYASTATDEQTWIPIDRRGSKADSYSLYGVKPSSASGAGGTANDNIGNEVLDGKSAAFLTASTQTLRSLFYGVCYGTGAVGNYATFVDSDSVSGTTLNILPPIYYHTFVYDEAILSPARSGCYNLPWPVVFVLGIVESGRIPGTDSFRVLQRPAGRLR